jgi:hypothetical protein
MGWTDRRAQEEFGVDDVFALANDLWEMSNNKIKQTPFTPKRKLSIWNNPLEAVRSFLRGTIFALPMALSVMAMLTLKFSLWSYVNLPLKLATSIAIGTVLSFMAVGGFIPFSLLTG